MSYKYYEGNWGEMRARAKLQWDKISYDELEQTRGNFDELADIIQERAHHMFSRIFSRIFSKGILFSFFGSNKLLYWHILSV